MKKPILFFVLSLCLASCAKHIVVNYSHAPDHSSTLVLQPDRPLDKAFLTVNGSMLVEKKNVKKITVKNLPSTPCDVKIVSESSYYKHPLDYQKTVAIPAGQSRTELVNVPPYGPVYYLQLSGLIALDIVLLAFLLL